MAGEESVLPVYRDRGDEHDRDHERGADGTAEAERDEQPAEDLGDGCGRGEALPLLEPEVHEKLAGLVEAITAEPAEELLRAVRGHDEADDDAADEEAERDGTELDAGGVHCCLPTVVVSL